MGTGFAPTWLRQVSPPASQNHFNHCHFNRSGVGGWSSWVGTVRKDGRKERRDTRNSGKLAIRPDHPRRRIIIKLCMVGGLQCVVIHVKCDPNQLRGYGAVGVENGPSLLLWPVAYTTACTNVQAVILWPTKNKPGGRRPLLSARPAVTCPAAEHHRPL